MHIYYHNLIDLLNKVPELEKSGNTSNQSLTITFGGASESETAQKECYETSDGYTIIIRIDENDLLLSLEITKTPACKELRGVTPSLKRRLKLE